VSTLLANPKSPFNAGLQQSEVSLLNSAILAQKVRLNILESLFDTGGGHYGGALSVVDVLSVLYLERQIALKGQAWDRVILSKGHAAVALYSVLKHLAGLGFERNQYGAYSAGLEGHPDMTATPNIHFSTGSLGQGLSVGLGMALYLRQRDNSRHVWVILGDGECQEGQIWEAAMLASRYKVANLHAVVDANGSQECGWAHDPTLVQQPLPDAKAKWKAFGWRVTTVDGHNHRSLRRSIKAAVRSDIPTVLLARTIKGRGVSALEKTQLHCGQLSDVEYAKARAELSN
jgi:transketolase